MNSAPERKISITEAQLAQMGGGHVGYIREIGASAASQLLGQPIELPDNQQLFCLYTADGTPIAISGTREAALASAEEHDLLPMSVH
jgi:hypothetical protein